MRSRSVMMWVVLATLASPAAGAAQQAGTPPVRKIPGITADDPFPQACVSCHVVLPDGKDVRLSTMLKAWTEGVDSSLLARAQSTARAGVTLDGKHPQSATATDVPAGCMRCHRPNALMAPPFGPLMHSIHLTGGDKNPFLTVYQGDCTNCHKLDRTTWTWSIPSGNEK